jgi:hydrogenase 3 maturation protease
MPDFREQLQRGFQGRVCLMGLGNADYGDDGLGVRLAGAVSKRLDKPGGRSGALEVIIAGTMPEGFVGRVAQEGFDHLVFLDAVEFGGAPGSVILLDAEQMAARFPQVSTHKISLGLLAKWVEASGTTRAWLLGVQPESLKAAQRLTPVVQKTVEVLEQLLSNISGGEDLSPPNNCRPDDQSQRWTYANP